MEEGFGSTPTPGTEASWRMGAEAHAYEGSLRTEGLAAALEAECC
ncbi:hypothetical protein ES332_D01G128900v1 [Gossypium tomentosum]|uniref:Uncharacterized protein n=1 Tax=Gossypium tomentosum TaxID=34277 RepID=A0A5D2M8X4_GOSTO|nr:hypothetical protein ES332_D01G128900v1 [Gossypium tomentosum]